MPIGRVPQHEAELLEERDPLVLADRIECEQLLELVEQQAWIGTRRQAIDAALHVVGEADDRELLGCELVPWRSGLLQGEEHAERVAVPYRHGLQRRWHGMAHTDGREHGEGMFRQLGTQPGLEQRTLPGTGRRVQQHDALGDQEVGELTDLVCPAVQVLAEAEGGGPT